MPGEEFGEKTEQPTERRLQDAREKGNVARSVDLNAAGLMMVVALMLYMAGGSTLKSLAEYLRMSITSASHLRYDNKIAEAHYGDLLSWAGQAVLPLLLAFAGAAMLLNILQIGFLFAPQILSPKWNHLNPMSGLQRIFSVRSTMKLVISLGKLALVVVIASAFVWYELPKFVLWMQAEPGTIAEGVNQSMAMLAFLLALSLVVLALLDFGFQKWKYQQDLMMTKQEVREEMKQMEGDPHIRQRRRETHRKMTQAREMQQVQDADVVITNPTHYSIAIQYDPDTMPAPKVIAKGVDDIALRIRRIAAENKIPIIERKELAQELYRTVKSGHFIPVEMYEVFVEIMAYVFRLTGRQAPKV